MTNTKDDWEEALTRHAIQARRNMNAKIIKAQNEAASKGKYMSKAQAHMEVIRSKEEDDN